MAATISVTLLNSASDDFTTLSVPAGTTVEQFLDLNNVNVDNMVVTLRVNQETISNWDLDDELQDGTRVTVSPEKIKGA